jgi:hypothetical protein
MEGARRDGTAGKSTPTATTHGASSPLNLNDEVAMAISPA